MGKYYEFNAILDSNLDDVKNILVDIINFLSDSIKNISDEDNSELKLIFSELICNAVIHGNKSNPKKAVHISIQINENIINSSIKDDGDGFDYLTFLDSHKNNENNLYYENGRGLWLVYSLTDFLSFNLYGNEVKFSKKVGI